MKEVIGPGGCGVGHWLAPRAGTGLVLLLCLAVFLQMLGVPATLFDAGGSFEIEGSSVLEGWSIQALSPQLPTLPALALVAGGEPSARVPILAGAFFRPPLS
jgi:hypothetical protein